MTKTAMVRARMEPGLKKDAERVMENIGLSPTEAIRILYRQVVLQDGLPFEIRVPKPETRAAIYEARSRKNLRAFKSVKDIKQAIDDDDAETEAQLKQLKAELAKAIKSLDAGKGKTVRGARQLATFLRNL